ncbi:MAG: hypothetical protein V7K35_13400 [Nostoc sp.]|uniref:hypothetical protein n=1 Tax=Nostoc sp. TaxID=1180 RepID=UPI002FF5A649
MTTTVKELIDVLKDYSDQMEITIKHDVDNQKFAIVDFQSIGNTLNFIISEKVEESEEAEAA